MNQAMSGTSALIYIIQALGGFYVFLVLMRFVLQLVGASFYNPITQFVVKATAPILSPLAKVLPTVGRVNFVPLIVAVLLKTLLILVILSIGAGIEVAGQFWGKAILWSVILLLGSLIKVFYFALIISVILSWVAPMSNHPAAELINQLVEPMLAPVRRLLPSLGGLDISPIFALIGLNLLESYVLANLGRIAGLPAMLVGFL